MHRVMLNYMSITLPIMSSDLDAGKSITALATHARTHEKALIVAGCVDGTSQVLHVQFPNRYAQSDSSHV